MAKAVGCEERAVTTLLTAKTGKREELLQILQSIVDEVRSDPRVLQAVVAQAIHSNDLFVMHIIWENAEGLGSYLASEGFKVMLGASSILSEPAQFSFIADETPQSARVTNKIRDLGAPGPGHVPGGTTSND